MALARDIVAQQLSQPLQQRMQEYYASQPVLPTPIARMAEVAPNPTPIAQAVQQAAPVAGVPTRVVNTTPSPAAVRAEVQHYTQSGQYVPDALRQQLAASGLVGQTSRVGHALGRAANLTGLPQYAQGAIWSVEHPIARLTSGDTMAVPAIGKSFALAGGRTISRVPLAPEQEAARVAMNAARTRELQKQGMSAKAAAQQAQDELGHVVKMQLQRPDGGRSSLEYTVKPDSVDLGHMQSLSAHGLNPVNSLDALDMIRQVLPQLEGRTLTGTVAWKGGGPRMEKIIKQMARREGYGDIKVKIK